MHAINNGKLFSAIHCRLPENPVTCNTQTQIILNGLKRSSGRNKQLTFLATISTDGPSIDQLLYIYHIVAMEICFL
jgi:hypothetical protein